VYTREMMLRGKGEERRERREKRRILRCAQDDEEKQCRWCVILSAGDESVLLY
jgi:hypothetical protein